MPNNKKKKKKSEKPNDDMKRFQMRINEDLCDEIDVSIVNSKTGISRNAWIIEAVVQRLKRENK